MAKLYTVLKADNKQLRNMILKELKDAGYNPVILEGEHVYADGDGKELYVSNYTLTNPPRYILNHGGILSARRSFGKRAGVYVLLELIKFIHPPVLFYSETRPYVMPDMTVKDYSFSGLTNELTINTYSINNTIEKEKQNG